MALFDRRGGSLVWSLSGSNGHGVATDNCSFVTHLDISRPPFAELHNTGPPYGRV